jgi:hypothetical protein
VPFRSVYNENAELDNAGVKPGAGGFGFFSSALKIGLVEKRSTQEAAKSVLVFMSNWVSLFLVVTSAHPTDKFLIKLTFPPGPEPDDYP